jgi:uncharacterized protein YdeI (YjbR/CyaY-like superfamily)
MKTVVEYCPENTAAWRRWLEANHDIADSVWLIFYKKHSADHNLSWSQAVDQALCFGWIDSTAQSIDSEKYRQYFCRRKAKSNWSRVNKDKVAVLIDQNLMAPAGYKSIEIAKANGSWTALDQVELLIVPDDLQQELVKVTGAAEYFDSLGKSDKKILLHWIISAKRKETREKRILEVVSCAGERSKPQRFKL